MSDFLRGLLGAATGAGQGYFQGKAMEQDAEERRRRAELEATREARAAQDQEWQGEDRAARTRAENSRVSEEFKGFLRGGAREAQERGFLERLMVNPEDTEAANELLQRNPQRLSAARTELGRREPPAPIKPPWEREGFGSEREQLGYLSRRSASQRAPSGGGAAAPPKSAQDEELEGQAILRRLQLQPKEIQMQFGEAFSQAFNPDVSPGRIAFRVWKAMRASEPDDAGDGPEAGGDSQAIYQQFYEEAIGMGRNPTEAAAYARQKMGQQ